jgi:hypothetical protein
MYLKNPILKLVDEPYPLPPPPPPPPPSLFFVLCDIYAFGVYDLLHLYTQFIASILDFFFFFF